MWLRAWLALTVSLVSLAWAAECPVRDNADVVRSAAYKACQQATGIDFDEKGKTPLDGKAFCSNPNCYILWKQVQELDALVCFQRYNVTGGYKLKKPNSSKRCFKANGILAIIVAPSDSASDSASDSNETDTSEETTDAPPATSKVTTLPTATPRNSTVSNPPPSGANAAAVPPTSMPPPPKNSAPPGGSATARQSASSSSTVPVIIGSCVTAVVLVSVALLVLYIRRRRSRTSNGSKEIATLEDGAVYVPTSHSSKSRLSDSGSVAVLSDRISMGEYTLPPTRNAAWEDDVIQAVRIPYEKITIGPLISRGGYGEVFQGTYRRRVVAVKCLLPERRNDMRQIENFLEEVKLMAALHHENIVRFIGVAWDSLNELCAVTEFMPRGDLRALLALYETSTDAPPTGFNPDKIKIALHISNALTYLHSLYPVMLHRDLKSRNVLLDENLNAKVTDFGVSREQASYTMTIGVGSSLWMAPEVMTGGYYDEKADVFSFGVVLSELDTHRLPYSHAIEPGRGRKLPDTVIVQMVASNRINVEFSDESRSPLAQLGRRCVELNPAARPTAAELQHALHQISRGGVSL